jgi:hypothetical protein
MENPDLRTAEPHTTTLRYDDPKIYSVYPVSLLERFGRIGCYASGCKNEPEFLIRRFIPFSMSGFVLNQEGDVFAQGMCELSGSCREHLDDKLGQ